jgi:hypothetical protein
MLMRMAQRHTMRIFWPLFLLAPAVYAQSATMVVAPKGCESLEADLRDAAIDLMYIMPSPDNAAALKSATDSGSTCIDNDLGCWQRMVTLVGGGSVIVLRPALNGVPAEVWFSAAGVERRTAVLSSGAPGMRYALERLQEKTGAIVVNTADGAQVTLDGQAASSLMQGVAPGEHTIVVTSVTGSVQTFTTTVALGKVTELNANEQVRLSPLFLVGGAAVGVGAVAIIAGTIVTVLASTDSNTFLNDAADNSKDGKLKDDSVPNPNEIMRNFVIGGVSLGVGAVLVGVGIGLIVGSGE